MAIQISRFSRADLDVLALLASKPRIVQP